MTNLRYLQHVEKKTFEIDYALYTPEGYVYNDIPEGFEVVDTQESREWHQKLLQGSRDSAAEYYSKNTTRFD